MCFMSTIRLAARVCQAQNVSFMKTIRIVERVCQAQNVCFISTTNSFQNVFRSNKYVCSGIISSDNFLD
jgi:hypothetical protein